MCLIPPGYDSSNYAPDSDQVNDTGGYWTILDYVDTSDVDIDLPIGEIIN